MQDDAPLVVSSVVLECSNPGKSPKHVNVPEGALLRLVIQLNRAMCRQDRLLITLTPTSHHQSAQAVCCILQESIRDAMVIRSNIIIIRCKVRLARTRVPCQLGCRGVRVSPAGVVESRGVECLCATSFVISNRKVNDELFPIPRGEPYAVTCDAVFNISGVGDPSPEGRGPTVSGFLLRCRPAVLNSHSLSGSSSHSSMGSPYSDSSVGPSFMNAWGVQQSHSQRVTPELGPAPPWDADTTMVEEVLDSSMPDVPMRDFTPLCSPQFSVDYASGMALLPDQQGLRRDHVQWPQAPKLPEHRVWIIVAADDAVPRGESIPGAFNFVARPAGKECVCQFIVPRAALGTDPRDIARTGFDSFRDILGRVLESGARVNIIMLDQDAGVPGPHTVWVPQAEAGRTPKRYDPLDLDVVRDMYVWQGKDTVACSTLSQRVWQVLSNFELGQGTVRVSRFVTSSCGWLLQGVISNLTEHACWTYSEAVSPVTLRFHLRPEPGTSDAQAARLNAGDTQRHFRKTISDDLGQAHFSPQFDRDDWARYLTATFYGAGWQRTQSYFLWLQLPFAHGLALDLLCAYHGDNTEAAYQQALRMCTGSDYNGVVIDAVKESQTLKEIIESRPEAEYLRKPQSEEELRDLKHSVTAFSDGNRQESSVGRVMERSPMRDFETHRGLLSALRLSHFQLRKAPSSAYRGARVWYPSPIAAAVSHVSAVAAPLASLCRRVFRLPRLRYLLPDSARNFVAHWDASGGCTRVAVAPTADMGVLDTCAAVNVALGASDVLQPPLGLRPGSPCVHRLTEFLPAEAAKARFLLLRRGEPGTSPGPLMEVCLSPEQCGGAYASLSRLRGLLQAHVWFPDHVDPAFDFEEWSKVIVFVQYPLTCLLAGLRLSVLPSPQEREQVEAVKALWAYAALRQRPHVVAMAYPKWGPVAQLTANMVLEDVVARGFGKPMTADTGRRDNDAPSVFFLRMGTRGDVQGQDDADDHDGTGDDGFDDDHDIAASGDRGKEEAGHTAAADDRDRWLRRQAAMSREDDFVSSAGDEASPDTKKDAMFTAKQVRDSRAEVTEARQLWASVAVLVHQGTVPAPRNASWCAVADAQSETSVLRAVHRLARWISHWQQQRLLRVCDMASLASCSAFVYKDKAPGYGATDVHEALQELNTSTIAFLNEAVKPALFAGMERYADSDAVRDLVQAHEQERMWLSHRSAQLWYDRGPEIKVDTLVKRDALAIGQALSANVWIRHVMGRAVHDAHTALTHNVADTVRSLVCDAKPALRFPIMAALSMVWANTAVPLERPCLLWTRGISRAMFHPLTTGSKGVMNITPENRSDLVTLVWQALRDNWSAAHSDDGLVATYSDGTRTHPWNQLEQTVQSNMARMSRTVKASLRSGDDGKGMDHNPDSLQQEAALAFITCRAWYGEIRHPYVSPAVRALWPAEAAFDYGEVKVVPCTDATLGKQRRIAVSAWSNEVHTRAALAANLVNALQWPAVGMGLPQLHVSSVVAVVAHRKHWLVAYDEVPQDASGAAVTQAHVATLAMTVLQALHDMEAAGIHVSAARVHESWIALQVRDKDHCDVHWAPWAWQQSPAQPPAKSVLQAWATLVRAQWSRVEPQAQEPVWFNTLTRCEQGSLALFSDALASLKASM